METRPALSIVICTRNRGDRLGPMLAALAAIRSERPWEVLLIDNASSDATPEVIRASGTLGGRLRMLRHDRIGLGAARDFAWREARGAILSFTDDDCYPDPDYVDAVLAAFADHPEAGCIGGRIRLHDPSHARVTIDERDAVAVVPPRRLVETGSFHGANLSVRRTALERAGGFDPALGAGTPFPCEDIDLVARCVWSGQAALFDPRPTVRHDHGRTEADLPRLMAAYDRGRGAYYAKFVARPDTRRAYLADWFRRAGQCAFRSDLAGLGREIGSGLRWLGATGRARWLPAGLLLALALGGRALIAVAASRLRRKLRRRSEPAAGLRS
ncbi:glycosyltransferase family 2 protein [Cereibacter azotoformans]|uniref:Glycosyltransferase 2-like domain-containing protein n=1 Tax=Cereibacter azotoformans TaxID=43057 RepID=A0A2T5JSS1_9RHOB|nr:glycosyltransferase [Cereibacter azotoformans]PTR12053.1 hypothetical protein C8J28_12512 [Cereibacter azotoformans]